MQKQGGERPGLTFSTSDPSSYVYLALYLGFLRLQFLINWESIPREYACRKQNRATIASIGEDTKHRTGVSLSLRPKTNPSAGLLSVSRALYCKRYTRRMRSGDETRQGLETCDLMLNFMPNSLAAGQPHTKLELVQPLTSPPPT